MKLQDNQEFNVVTYIKVCMAKQIFRRSAKDEIILEKWNIKLYFTF